MSYMLRRPSRNVATTLKKGKPVSSFQFQIKILVSMPNSIATTHAKTKNPKENLHWVKEISFLPEARIMNRTTSERKHPNCNLRPFHWPYQEEKTMTDQPCNLDTSEAALMKKECDWSILHSAHV